MPKNDIINSFEVKDELCPLVWDGKKLKKPIKDKLLDIADEFLDFVEEKIFVDDIIIIGSLVNYNWSKYSDFDLHLVINFEQFGDNSELYKNLLDLKKVIFNQRYNIVIKNHEVEVYPQDALEEYYSSGAYSIVNDKWIKKPSPEKANVDKKLLKDKIKYWESKIDTALKYKEKDDLTEYKNRLKRINDQLKKFRKIGLEKEGEYSYENLTFKYLRRSGHIGKLKDSKVDKINKELSLEYMSEQISSFLNLGEPKFIKDLKNIKTSVTQLKKDSTSKDVEMIQNALVFLGFDLSMYGVDGKFGSETEKAVKDFQTANKLNPTGIITSKEIDVLIEKLKASNFKDSDLTKRRYELPKSSDKFTYLDLETKEGFETYKKICDNFIKSKNPQSPVTGQMLAESARKYFNKGYVPPELACAQLLLEGGLSKEQNARPIYTKNPFNVGNVDTGKNKYMRSFQDGVDAYYALMTTKYLPKGKKAEDIMANFTNIIGNRYASNVNYEKKLDQIIMNIAKT
jgi:peptidoglycan hydrolase-like protein with peptidoglycan-binding domain